MIDDFHWPEICGNVTVKIVPSLCLLTKSIVPFNNSTYLFMILSPKPVPWIFPVLFALGKAQIAPNIQGQHLVSPEFLAIRHFVSLVCPYVVKSSRYFSGASFNFLCSAPFLIFFVVWTAHIFWVLSCSFLLSLNMNFVGQSFCCECGSQNSLSSAVPRFRW